MMPPVGRAGQTLWVACLAAFCARPAFAEDRARQTTARLEWTRGPDAESCVDGPGLEAAVSRRWGREVFVDDSSADIVVKGFAKRGAQGGWSVRLELEHTDGNKLGSREIVTRAPDCSSLDDSVALALGLMLDLTERASPPVEAPQASVAPPPSVSGPPITIPKETPAARARWHFEATIGGEIAVGLLPGLAIGARPAVALEPPRFWRIEFGGTIWQDRSAGSDQAGARISMWTLDLAVCPISTSWQRFAASVCVAQRAGKIAGEGMGFDSNVATDDTFLSAEARAGLTWIVAGPLILRAGFGLAAPFVRFRFVYREDPGNIATVYQMPPVAGIVGLGMGAHF
jgi:hypothetical protein